MTVESEAGGEKGAPDVSASADESEKLAAAAADEGDQSGDEDSGKDKETPDGDEKEKGDGEGDKPEVPETYELTLPEDSKLNDSDLEKAAELAKEFGLSNEQAQRLVESQSADRQGFLDQMKESHDLQVDQWAKDIEADKDFGGANFEKSSEDAKRVIDRFSDDEFKTLLDDTGYGNNPNFFKFVAKIGAAMSSDDDFVTAGDGGDGKTAGQRMFPTMNKKD